MLFRLISIQLLDFVPQANEGRGKQVLKVQRKFSEFSFKTGKIEISLSDPILNVCVFFVRIRVEV